MKRLLQLPPAIQQSLKEQRLIKVITGLSNFNVKSVEKIAKAAGLGGADLLDVGCDPHLVEVAAKVSSLPICVSAVNPELFPPAVDAGAALIEIGNFDSFYPKGIIFDAEKVLELTQITRKILPNIFLSVTVPHMLPLDQQAQLALNLIKEGADLIQTEGGTSAKPINPGAIGLIEKATPTLASTFTIAKAIKSSEETTPILCASGLSAVTAPLAIAAGASGIGIGSAINKLESELEMVAAVKNIKEAMHSMNRQFA